MLLPLSRQYVISQIPGLEILDDTEVLEKERIQARKTYRLQQSGRSLRSKEVSKKHRHMRKKSSIVIRQQSTWARTYNTTAANQRETPQHTALPTVTHYCTQQHTSGRILTYFYYTPWWSTTPPSCLWVVELLWWQYIYFFIHMSFIFPPLSAEVWCLSSSCSMWTRLPSCLHQVIVGVHFLLLSFARCCFLSFCSRRSECNRGPFPVGNLDFSDQAAPSGLWEKTSTNPFARVRSESWNL